MIKDECAALRARVVRLEEALRGMILRHATHGTEIICAAMKAGVSLGCPECGHKWPNPKLHASWCALGAARVALGEEEE